AERRFGKGRSLRRPRIALWDEYGGSISSGWLRYIFDNFDFAYDVVFLPQLDTLDLKTKYDVIVLPDGSVPDSLSTGPDEPSSLRDVPTEWKSRMGRFTSDNTLPQLRAFVEQGGRLVTIGRANYIAKHFTLPLDMPDFKREEFYVPGSILEIKVDTTADVAAGMTAKTLAFFDNSPFFQLKPEAANQGIRVVASFEKNPLRSGWAWGQE